jgi:hypothetical protein
MAALNMAGFAAGLQPQKTLSSPSISQITDQVSNAGAANPSKTATDSSSPGRLTKSSDMSKEGNSGHKAASINTPAHHHIPMNIKVPGRWSPSRKDITCRMPCRKQGKAHQVQSDTTPIIGVASSTQTQLGMLPGRVRMPESAWIRWISQAATQTAPNAGHEDNSTRFKAHDPRNKTTPEKGTNAQATG